MSVAVACVMYAWRYLRGRLVPRNDEYPKTGTCRAARILSLDLAGIGEPSINDVQSTQLAHTRVARHCLVSVGIGLDFSDTCRHAIG